MNLAGISLRILIVTAWLGLLGWHFVRYTMPDLWTARRFDPAAIMAVNIDRAFRYEVRRFPKDKQPVAECSLMLAQDDVRYRSTTLINIKDLNAIQPGLSTLLRSAIGVKNQRQSSITVTMSQVLDARFRLVEAEASGNAMGLAFTARGTVDAKGLHGHYRVGEGPQTPIELPAITPDMTQGSELALSLPPRLKPGDSFSARMMHLDPLQMSARPSVGVFTVEEAETITLAKKAIACNRVALAVDNRPAALLWADQDGVVYRLKQNSTGMTLDLVAITSINGTAIWPEPAPPADPP